MDIIILTKEEFLKKDIVVISQEEFNKNKVNMAKVEINDAIKKKTSWNEKKKFQTIAFKVASR